MFVPACYSMPVHVAEFGLGLAFKAMLGDEVVGGET